MLNFQGVAKFDPCFLSYGMPKLADPQPFGRAGVTGRGLAVGKGI